MKVLNKILAVFLIFVTLAGIFPANAFAAGSPVYIYVDSYVSGKVRISWDFISGIDSIEIGYNKPGEISKEIISLPADATNCEISGLENDYIYNIELYTIKGGTKERRGLLFFLPGITFRSEIVEEPMDDENVPPYDPAGGREIGTKPRLKLSWNIPRIFISSETDPKFEYANEALLYIQDQINNVYGTSYNIKSFDYQINISQDSQDMSGNAAVEIKQEGSGYIATVSGGTSSTSVNIADGRMEIELLGRKDRNTALPSPTADGELPHPDILPGTIYFMNIQTKIDEYQDAVVLGRDGYSPLEGKAYTYTPIRFQIFKDEQDNVNVKVYTINQGSLLLPNLYYEVQSNTVNSAYGWKLRARLDPDYFKDASGKNLEYGLIPIISEGGEDDGSKENKIYYRVVVTSENADVLKSQALSYIIKLDKSKPPIPKDVKIIDRIAAIDEDSGRMSTDVTISWDEPLSWKEIKENPDDNNDIYFCFMLNISQTDITQRPYPPLIDEVNGIEHEDYFPAKYRLVKYVNARSVLLSDENADKIRENNGRLEYTLKGFDLFTWTDKDGNKFEFSSEFRQKMGIEDDYPDFLLSNRVYYLQMFTVKGDPQAVDDIMDIASDKSVTVSFTTLSFKEKEVPLPDNFRLAEPDGNTYVKEGDAISNIIKLQFNKISNIKWDDYTVYSYDNRVFYDLYMSTASDGGFILIGSTSNINDDEYMQKNNVEFMEVDEGGNKYIVAKIKDFTKDPAITSFGYKLTPNTTYYFKLKTRFVMARKDPATYPDDYDIRESQYSFILSVTTVKGDITPPDPSEKVPLAPSDFSIALDENGNELRTATSVVFNWTRQENDVKYTLICTSKRLPMNADPSQYLNDPLYQEFKKAFNIDSSEVGIEFDPGLPADQNPEGFEYKDSTKLCIYKLDEWLFPNRLYFFSLRAENKDNGNVSPWISIPVTTRLIEAPEYLEALKRGELGFFWTDSISQAKPEDYNIYIKGPNDKDYKLVPRSQCTVVKDSKPVPAGGEIHYVYYGRVKDLELNTSYDIRVYRGSEDKVLVYQKTGASTRNVYYELEVKWKGIKGYRYEIAIKLADEVDYVILTPEDLEIYTDIDGNRNPYYTEETLQTYNSDDMYYFARIKSMLVTLPNGLKERKPLQSNKKYHIKVRAVKIDPVDTTIAAYSKYTGPVEARTEFNQDDYEKDKDQEDREIKFRDKISQLEERLFWRVDIRNNSANKILLRNEKVVNVLQNSPGSSLTIDISGFVQNLDTDIVYIPLGVINAVNSKGKNLVIKTSQAEFTIRPGTLNTESIDILRTLNKNPMTSDVLIELTILRTGSGSLKLPESTQAASKVIDLNLHAAGINRTAAELEKMIHDRLYNEEDGLVSEKLNLLLSTYTGSGKSASGLLEQYIDELVKLVETELSAFIGSTIGAIKISGMSGSINSFSSPMLAKLFFSNTKGLKYPYVLYNGKSSWQKITSNVVTYTNYLVFQPTGTGKFVVLLAWNAASDMPDGHWAKRDVEKFLSKYDLSDVFYGIDKTFAPEDNVTAKEIVLLYEVVMDLDDENAGLDIRTKVKNLGLGDIINVNRIMGLVTKQETAAVIARIFCAKMGIRIENIKLGRNVYINDEIYVDSSFEKAVMFVVDNSILKLDANGNFNPKASVSRAEVISAFVKVLEKTGDL
ncbi:MAG TPA: hypothetical protein GXX14_06645 [Clostridiaceae bacterium]|nr:hypothetical protein [Clostridiaceae bacterium]